MKNMFILIVLMLLISIVSSFVIKPMSTSSSSSSLSLKKYNKNVILKMNNDKIDELSSYELPSSALLISLSTLLIPYQEAMANDYGILAGRTASMLHPVTMLMLFLTSV
jgi:uncharacterized protein YceK